MSVSVPTRSDVSMEQDSPRSTRRQQRRGATIPEFAIVATILFMLIFGLVEFGRVVMIEQLLTNASREGARRAILESATNASVEQTVEDYLASVSVNGATVTITPSDLSHVGFGDKVTVSVSVPFNDVSWIPAPFLFNGMTLSGQSVMRGERPE